MNDSDYDKQMLDTIVSILTRCRYPQEWTIYYIVSELAERGYAVPTKKTKDINKRWLKSLHSDG